MIEVITHGNKPTYYGTCLSCGCQVKCSEGDIKYDSNSSAMTKYILCPECGNKIMLNQATWGVAVLD